MPHKHRRKQKDEADYELPPDTIARPLTVVRHAETGKSGSKSRKRKRAEDDTPKEFQRLMNRMKLKAAPKARDAEPSDKTSSKKRKKGSKPGTSQGSSKETVTEAEAKPEAAPGVEAPRILPGERLADFSARVDQALPINGLVTKGKVDLPGVKRQRTKLERKITRMQDEWREREKRYRNKLAEAEEDEEIEAIMNGDDHGRTFRILDEEDSRTTSGRKKGKKGRRKGRSGNDSDDDPWAALAKSRKQTEQASSGLVGLHDVVQAPPRFNVQPKEKFKIQQPHD